MYLSEQWVQGQQEIVTSLTYFFTSCHGLSWVCIGMFTKPGSQSVMLSFFFCVRIVTPLLPWQIVEEVVVHPLTLMVFNEMWEEPDSGDATGLRTEIINSSFPAKYSQWRIHYKSNNHIYKHTCFVKIVLTSCSDHAMDTCTNWSQGISSGSAHAQWNPGYAIVQPKYCSNN